MTCRYAYDMHMICRWWGPEKVKIFHYSSDPKPWARLLDPFYATFSEEAIWSLVSSVSCRAEHVPGAGVAQGGSGEVQWLSSLGPQGAGAYFLEDITRSPDMRIMGVKLFIAVHSCYVFSVSTTLTDSHQLTKCSRGFWCDWPGRRSFRSGLWQS